MIRLAPVFIALALAACGDDRYAAEREQAERLMPGVDELRCHGEPRRDVSCEGTRKGRTVFCEFRYEDAGGDNPAYSGSSSCWTER